LLAVGLLFRLEAASKTMMILAAVLIVLSAIEVLGLLAVHSKLNQDQVNYNRAVSQVNQSNSTVEQRHELADLSSKFQAAKKKVGHAFIAAEVNAGLETAVAIGTIIYLNMPKVRRVFHRLES
jgi:hypothetical protein